MARTIVILCQCNNIFIQVLFSKSSGLSKIIEKVWNERGWIFG